MDGIMCGPRVLNALECVIFGGSVVEGGKDLALLGVKGFIAICERVHTTVSGKISFQKVQDSFMIQLALKVELVTPRATGNVAFPGTPVKKRTTVGPSPGTPPSPLSVIQAPKTSRRTWQR